MYDCVCICAHMKVYRWIWCIQVSWLQISLFHLSRYSAITLLQWNTDNFISSHHRKLILLLNVLCICPQMALLSVSLRFPDCIWVHHVNVLRCYVVCPSPVPIPFFHLNSFILGSCCQYGEWLYIVSISLVDCSQCFIFC